MTFSDALFTLLIGPLKTLFELIYVLVYKLTQNPGISIIGLSLVMNFLLLPLYNQTDAIQLEAIETEKRLKPFVSHIKKTFKGNEQFMMLQTCYRQNNYKPTDAIKGISPLLLEIPFFMAAYNYLSNLGLLEYATFGPIADLGRPDGLLVLGSLHVNLLPILMTLINICSSLIYTKDAPLKTKIQLYGMAALFLVLLYDSPSGLVFYWTLNNLFSLVKNIFIKMKHPRKVINILASLAGIGALVYFLAFRELDSLKKYVFVFGLALGLQLPLVLSLVQSRRKAPAAPRKNDRAGFFLSCGFLAILLGVLIPSAVIKASPAEFVDFTRVNPLFHVLSTALMGAGTFLIWLPIFYTISSDSGKRVLSLGVWVFACVAVVDYMFFGSDYGTLSPDLKYLELPAFGRAALNAGLVVLTAAAAFLVWKKKGSLIRFACATLGLAIALMSVMNLGSIQSGYRDTIRAMGSGRRSSSDAGIIPLNKDGKNVVVLMMDRAIGAYIPYLMNEKPELLRQFDGFTYYPNTASFGGFTNVGTPALFGGYDYTPEMMNRRDQESLESKQNEALKVMPVLFDQNGYEVTVCEPTYAGYQWIPDLSIYDEYKNIATYHPIEYCNDRKNDHHQSFRRSQKNRNFFHYSLMRSLPVVAQPVIYSGGSYNAFQREHPFVDVPDASDAFTAAIGSQERSGLHKATGIYDSFFHHYTILDHLPSLTRIQDSDRNTFMMMSNDTTHEPSLLQEPAYEPAPVVDNTEYEAAHADRFSVDGRTMVMEDEQQFMHYQINMAAMLKLGQWFDFLRENDVYDNTRIIIVADHGRNLRQFDELIFGDFYFEDGLLYNPLLMVKDFGAAGFTTDDSFMTNADVPALATADLIENPVNLFTGNPITTAPKADPIHILYSEWDTSINNGNTFLPGPQVCVHDNIWDTDNWETLSRGE